MRRRLFLVLAPIGLVVLFYLLLPRFAGMGLRHLMLRQGFDDVVVGPVDIALFDGRFGVAGVRGERNGAPLRLDRFGLDLEWSELFHHRAVLRQVEVHGLALRVKGGPGGRVTISGLALPAPAAGDADKSSWAVGIDRLVVRDSSVDLQYGAMERRLAVSRLEVRHLQTWREDGVVEVDFAGRLGGTPISCRGSLQPFGRSFRGEVALHVQGLDGGALVTDLRRVLPDAFSEMPEIDKALINGDITVRVDTKTIVQEGTVSIEEFAATKNDSGVSGGRLAWTGTLTYAMDGHITADGRLDGEGLALHHGAHQLNIAGLGVTGQLALTVEKAGRFQGRVRAQGPQLSADGLTVDFAGLDGQLEAVMNGEGKGSATGTIGLDGVRVRQDAADLLVTAGGIRWQGGVALEEADQSRVTGEVTVSDLHCRQGAVTLARAGEIALRDIAAGEREAGVAGARIKDLQLLLTEGQPVATAGTVAIGASRWTPERLQVGRVTVAGVAARVVRQAEGGLLGVSGLAGKGEATTAGAKHGPAWRIDGLEVQGPAVIAIRDLAVTPALETTVTVDELQLAALASDGEAWAPVKLAARVGEYGRLAMEGRVRPPLGATMDSELTAQVEQLALVPFSGYSGRYLGHSVDSGQLTGEVRLAVHGGRLAGKADLTLNKLAVSKLDPEKAAALEAAVDMPLATALGLLRDNDDNIHLELPLAGDLANPEVDISQVVATAVGKAVRTAALTYVQVALQPYGALLFLGRLAKKAADRAGLAPVAFVPGSGEPAADGRQYLEKLAGLLEKRPGLRLRLCGRAGKADREALLEEAQQRLAEERRAREATAKAAGGRSGEAKDTGDQPATPQGQSLPVATVAEDTLLQLAAERGEAVKAALVARGISAARLFLCRPEVDEGGPRVEVGL